MRMGSRENTQATEALSPVLGEAVTDGTQAPTALCEASYPGRLWVDAPTIGTSMLGKKVLCPPSFLIYTEDPVQADGKLGPSQAWAPGWRLPPSPPWPGWYEECFSSGWGGDGFQLRWHKDFSKWKWWRKPLETPMQVMFRMLAHPSAYHLHVLHSRFCGPRAKDSPQLSPMGKVFIEERLLGFSMGLTPQLLGGAIFLWTCWPLHQCLPGGWLHEGHARRAGQWDHNPGSQFSQALAIRSHPKFVMGVSVSMLTYPFLLVSDLMPWMTGLHARLPAHSPVFQFWIHGWKDLSVQGQHVWGSSLLFCWVASRSWFVLE